MLAARKESYDKPKQHIKKAGHHIVDNILYSYSYDFSSSHVCMWELDHKKGWVPKKLMLSNYGSGEDFWESPGLKRDQTNQS